MKLVHVWTMEWDLQCPEKDCKGQSVAVGKADVRNVQCAESTLIQSKGWGAPSLAGAPRDQN